MTPCCRKGVNTKARSLCTSGKLQAHADICEPYACKNHRDMYAAKPSITIPLLDIFMDTLTASSAKKRKVRQLEQAQLTLQIWEVDQEDKVCNH